MMTLPAPVVAALRKHEQAHKYSHGHLLVLSGGVGRGGAARLAARAALRIGAGVVTIACPPAALQENAARLDAIMLRPLRDADQLAALLGDDRINALCLGPGLGLGARETALVGGALAAGRACVLDADALTLLAASDELRAALHPACVLTPHAGEFTRLCPDLASEAITRVEAVTTAAERLGCVVLLKGAETVLASPDGATATASATGDAAAPWLATAGSGDVLAGIIAGLLARGFTPMDAGLTGALVHQAAARLFGPGLIAEDLPELIPQVLRASSV
jgi:ADP-dependent NAD(P)H-hydrate dehydratase / NAD(P)H-hydrate epimerase